MDISQRKISEFAQAFDGVGVVSSCGRMWGSNHGSSCLVVSYDENDDTYVCMVNDERTRYRVQFDLPSVPTPTPSQLQTGVTDALFMLVVIDSVNNQRRGGQN